MRFRTAIFALILPILALCSERVNAETFVVTTTAQQGKGSFNDAIRRANEHTGQDRIIFEFKDKTPRIIRLDEAVCVISDDLVVEGTPVSTPEAVKIVLSTEGGIQALKNVVFKNIGLVKSNRLTYSLGSEIGFDNCIFISQPSTNALYSATGLTEIDNIHFKKCRVSIDDVSQSQVFGTIAYFIYKTQFIHFFTPINIEKIIRNAFTQSIYKSKSNYFKLIPTQNASQQKSPYFQYTLALDTIPAADEECAHNSNEMGILVGFNGELILEPQAITECIGGNLPMTVQVSGGSGTITYQWQSSDDGIAWTNMTGEVGATMIPPSSTAGAKFYRVEIITDGADKCGPIYTRSAKATVVSDPTVTIAANKTEICSGENLGITATITGGEGTPVLKWQSSTDGSTWVDIAGATSSVLNINNQTQTTFYRVLLTQSNGCDATSPSVEVKAGGCSGMIGDFVWLDCNRDGIQNGGEAGIGGVPVTLRGTTSTGETVNESTTTSATGIYRFTNIKPGRYRISFGFPSGKTGLSFTKKGEGSVSTGSDADGSGQTDEFTVGPNEVLTDIDAGIIDATPPAIITAAIDMKVGCDGSGNVKDLEEWLKNHAGAVFADNWSDDVTWTHNYTRLSDECGLTGKATVTFTATDNCGNSTSTTATFVIEDKTGPSFVNIPQNFVIDCKDPLPTFEPPKVTDFCDFDAKMTEVITRETGCGANYKIIRTWTATDACGNITTVQQTISVEDKASPIILNVPPNTKITCKEKLPDGTGIVARDVCDPTPRITMSDLVERGSCGANYKIIRIWTAADACGNTATGTQIIEVGDVDAPELSNIPADITVDCGSAVPSPTQSGVRATDGCSTPRVTVSDRIQRSACVDNYTIFRTWTATDQCGNTAQRTQRIVVEDKTPPELLQFPADRTVNLWQGQTVPAAPTLTATDNCDSRVDVVRTEQRVNDLCGYTLNRTWTATDNCNNRTTKTQVISVRFAENLAAIKSTTPEGCTARTGAVELTPNTPNYVYTWSDGARGAVRTNMAAGTYKVTATVSNTCSKIIDVVITRQCGCEKPAVTIAKRDVTCDNPTAGAATLTATNGLSGDFRYLWSPAVSTNNTASNLKAGQYTVRVERVNDRTCFNEVIVRIDTPSVIDVKDPIVTVGDCQNPIGKVEFEVVAGDSLRFKWPDGDSSRVRLNLAAGTYDVTVSRPGANACPAVKKVVIGESGSLKATHVVNRQPSCGVPNGSVTINTTGGSGNYIYSWGEGNSRHVLNAGSISVTVTDVVSGCKTVVSFTLLNETPEVKINMDTITQLTCAGLTDGRIVYTLQLPDGFRNPAKVEIRNKANVLMSNGTLSVGDYILQVRDSTGCLAGEKSFKVIEPPAITTNVTRRAQTCDALGSISINTTGGNGGYKYNWSDLNGQPNQPNFRFDLKSASYTITVSDVAGCQRVVRNIVVVDSCNCRPPVLEDIQTTNAECGKSNGTLTLVLRGGNESSYTYAWSPNVGTANTVGNSRTDLPAGEYTVTITSKNNPTCQLITKVGVGAVSSGFFVNFNGSMEPATCSLPDGKMSIYPAPSDELKYTWLLDGKETNVREDLKSGVYQVKVTSPNFQCPIFLTVKIEETNPLDAWAVTLIQPDCGVANGTVELQAEGGSGQYSYSWGSSAKRTDVKAGVYRVTVTDTQWGCKDPVTFAVNDKNTAPATVNIDNGIVYVTCPGRKDGKIDFTIEYGPNFVGPGKVIITDGLGREYENGRLPVGEYCIEVRDAKGCVGGSGCFFVREPAPIKAFPITLDKNCDEGGMVFMSLSGGTGGAYIFNWSDKNDLILERNRDSLAAGTYAVTVYDVNGCALILNDIKIKDECPNSDKCAGFKASAAVTDKSCTEGGKILTTIKGGNAPFTFDWLDMTGAQNPQNRFDLDSGRYTVVVRDISGCSDTLSNILIKNNCPNLGQNCTPPNIVGVNVIDASCGNTDGQISVTVVSNNSVTYAWSPNISSTTNVADKLEGGVYKVRVSNINDRSCYVEREIVVKNRDAIQLESPIILSASCGTSNGVVTFNTAGKLYNFIWSDGKTGNPRSDLAKGRYYITVTDFSKTMCPQYLVVDVPTNNALLGSAVIDRRAACNVSNGQATIRMIGGSGSYSYSWGNSATKSDLAAGVHNVTVTDNQTGCTAVITFTMPNEVVATAAVNIAQPILNLACAGDANASVIFNVIYSNGFPQPSKVEIRDNRNRLVENDKLSAGKYSILVFDANKCLAGTGVFEVREPQMLLTSVAAHPVTCNKQGSINLSVSGGSGIYAYKWGDLTGNDQPRNRENLNVGTYNVSVSDSKGCTVIYSKIAIENQKINCDGSCTLDVTANVKNQSCTEGGSIQLVVTGGSGKIRYNWAHIQGNNNQKDLTNLGSGSYTVFVFDSTTNCRDTLRDIKINASSQSIGVAPTVTAQTCTTKGSINLDISGGAAPFTYRWNDLAGSNQPKDRTNLNAGTYIVTVSDSKGCQTIRDNIIVQNNAVNCNGNNACDLEVNVDVTHKMCNMKGGSLVTTVYRGIAPYKFDWTDLEGTDNPQNRYEVPVGKYVLYVTDAQGCRDTFLNIVVRDSCPANCTPPVISNVSLSDSRCLDTKGSINLTMSDAASYIFRWSPRVSTTNIASNLSAGSYRVRILRATDTLCFIDKDFIINNADNPIIIGTPSVIDATCGTSNGSIIFNNVKPTLTFRWNDGQLGSSRQNLAAGTYHVSVTDPSVGSCPKIVTVVVKSSGGLSASANIVKNPSCGQANGQVQISVANGSNNYSYSWGGATKSDLRAGSYFVTVYDNQTGCQGIVSFNLNDNIASKATISINNPKVAVSCRGLSNASVVYNVTYDDGFATPATVNIVDGFGNVRQNGNLRAGTYYIVVRDARSCVAATASFEVIDPDILMAEAEVRPINCDSSGTIKLAVSGGTTPYNFDWADVAGTNNSRDRYGLALGKYSVTVTDGKGCVTSLRDITIDNVCKNIRPKRDTVYRVVQAGKGEVICPPYDAAIANFTLTYTFCEGGTSLNGAFGNATTTSAGCLDYRPRFTNGTETICIRGCTGTGVCDTTIYIITVTDNPNLCTDMYKGSSKVSVTSCDSLATVCTAIPFRTSANYVATDNGSPISFTNTGCSNDTVFAYTYFTLTRFYPVGPWTLDGWSANGGFYKATIPTMQALADSMNKWDAGGNWVVNTATSSIVGGVPGRNYGSMIWKRNGTTIANFQTTQQVTPSVVAIRLDTGFHRVIFRDITTNCLDTADITVECNTEIKPVSYRIEKTIEVNQRDTICLNNEALAGITTISNICIKNYKGFVGYSIDENTDCIRVIGASVGKDSLCLRRCYGTRPCDTVTVIITVKPATIKDTCLTPYTGPKTISVACGSQARICTNILAQDTSNYQVTINGVRYGQPFVACSADTLNSYTYFSLTLVSPTGPYTLQSWMVDNKTISGVAPNIRALVDSMNKWDAGGNWRLDAARYTIIGGKPGSKYGEMIWIRNGSRIATLSAVKLTIVRQVGIMLGEGKNTVVFRNIVNGCTHTEDITVQCQGALAIRKRQPKAKYSVERAIVVGYEGKYCVDVQHLNGLNYQLINICEPNTTDNVNFIIQDNCVTYLGDNIGKDTACLILRDQANVSDTIQFIVTVTEGDRKTMSPIAVNDKATTLKDNRVVIVPIRNDTTHGFESQIVLITEPKHGVAELDRTTGNVTYRQTGFDCVTRDTFRYAIINEAGSDTAWIDVEIVCDEVVVFSGFSPNGDGINDRFMVLGLEKYPNHTLMIFNKTGYQVFVADNYQNNWDGTVEGQPLPDGTYFWVIELGNGKKLSGYVQLHR